MELVVDANILFSFFKENPVRLIITNSEFLGLKLFTPEYVIDELKKNESDILKYSNLNQEQFNKVLLVLSKFIETIPKKFFKQFESKAKQLIHSKDIPIFALALKLNCPIWSNELAFKKQSKIKIFSTRDLRQLMRF